MIQKMKPYCVFHMFWAALTFFLADSAVKGGLMSAIVGDRTERCGYGSSWRDGGSREEVDISPDK